jgi:DNA mismatch repair ATPase MutS
VQIKSQYMDVIIFMKIGTFYEAWEEDAVIVNSVFPEWKLTRNGVGGCRQVGTTNIEAAKAALVNAGELIYICFNQAGLTQCKLLRVDAAL